MSTSVTVQVAPASLPGPTPSPAALSTTGTDLLPSLVAGALLLLAGAALVWRRRSTTREPARPERERG